MDIRKNVMELTGNTPLMEVTNIEKELGLKARLLVKLEYLNPTGSAKDRAALYMVKDGVEKGLIKEGTVLIEPTSGNTGIGLASISASMGLRLILTMPETMSVERRNILKAYGAEIVLTEGSKGMSGAIEKAEALKAEIPGSIIPGQFVNPANPYAHYVTTGPEIYRDSDGTVDIFVAGVGTGGTITGVGKYLKEKKESVKVVAVEPDTSAVISGEKPGPHGLQGIGAGFIPDALDVEVIDEIVKENLERAVKAAKLLGTKEGILVGITSGASLDAAIELAKKEENEGKVIVALLPDSADRYYSTALFG
ncbi:MAG: cysteine synthase A [Clostridia bacterium]|nr:cysteine synthase A [Clostridia bacterium]